MIVKILGHEYRLSSTAAGPDRIEQVAGVLDRRMREVSSKVRRKVPVEIAILAAMEIADEVLEARQRRDRFLANADEQISLFTRRIESSGSRDLSGDEPPPPHRF